jgi:SNF2 family DNA or RNA helicase
MSAAEAVARLRAAGVPIRSPHILAERVADRAILVAVAAPVGSAGVITIDPSDDGPLGSVELSWRVAHSLGLTGDTRAAVGRASRRGSGPHPGHFPSDRDIALHLWQRLAYLLKPPAELLLSIHGPIEWPANLFGYQLQGVTELLTREALLLADDLGLGKTVQAIAALRVLLLQHQVEAGLIVVPASLVDQWRYAIRQWAPELRTSTIRGPGHERAWQWLTPAHIYLTSYDTLCEDYTDNPQAPPRRRTWDVVILDEAQRIKNRETRTSRVCKELLRRRAWALTGTPLENTLDELASVLEFVTPRHDARAGERLFPGRELLARQRVVQLRRRKQDVLPQLPPKILGQLVVALGPMQRAAYDRAEREGIVELRERGHHLRIENVLELITRLKQICNADPASGQSAKLADLHERMSALVAEGHRALVFTQFTDATFGVMAIAARLAAFRPLVYTGEVLAQRREDIIRTFRADPGHQLMILSLRAGGLGLNLQEASYVFHFDRWWNPAVERQAEDRSHRIGQTYPVHVFAYVCADTIEERIAALLQRKQVLFDEIVDGVTLDLQAKLSADELFGLFGIQP